MRMKFYLSFNEYNQLITESSTSKLNNAIELITNAEHATTNKKIGHYIGRALKKLDNLNVNKLSKKEQSEFVKAYNKIKEIIEGDESTFFIDEYPRREERFNSIEKIVNKIVSRKKNNQKKEEFKEKPDETKKQETETETETETDDKKDNNDIEEGDQVVDIKNNNTNVKIAETTKKYLNKFVPKYIDLLNREYLPLLSVKYGTTNLTKEVSLLQIILKYGETENGKPINLYKNKINGEYTDETVSAVKQFQSKYNLKVDGVVGKNTWNTILNIFGISKDVVKILKPNEYIEKYPVKKADESDSGDGSGSGDGDGSGSGDGDGSGSEDDSEDKAKDAASKSEKGSIWNIVDELVDTGLPGDTFVNETAVYETLETAFGENGILKSVANIKLFLKFYAEDGRNFFKDLSAAFDGAEKITVKFVANKFASDIPSNSERGQLATILYKFYKYSNNDKDILKAMNTTFRYTLLYTYYNEKQNSYISAELYYMLNFEQEKTYKYLMNKLLAENSALNPYNFKTVIMLTDKTETKYIHASGSFGIPVSTQHIIKSNIFKVIQRAIGSAYTPEALNKKLEILLKKNNTTTRLPATSADNKCMTVIINLYLFFKDKDKEITISLLKTYPALKMHSANNNSEKTTQQTQQK